MNVQFDAMVKKLGREEAERRCDEIEALTGAGQGSTRYIGGVDIFGALAESNEAISNKDKARIAELSDTSRKSVEKKIEDGRKAVERGDRSKDNIIPPDSAMDVNRK